MMKARSPFEFIAIAATALLLCLGGIGAATAQSAPDPENGRYALSPIAGGVMKLDTRTGAVATCINTGTGWACYAVPDERAALDAEIGRLQADNEKLKAQLASREPTVSGKIDERAALDAEIGRLRADNEKLKAQLASREPTVSGKIDEPLPKTNSLKKPEPKVAEGERKIEIPLPSDRDMDRVMSFLEQAWKRLIEMANRVQKDVTGKI